MSDSPQHPTPSSSTSRDSPPSAVVATPSGFALRDASNCVPPMRRSVKTEPLVTTAATTAEVYAVVDEDINYGPANRLNTLKIAYYSRQYERELVFSFHRNSAEVAGAGEYRCVECQRIDPKWECIVYVRNNEFIGLDPDYGIRGHCCVKNPPPATIPSDDQENVDSIEEPSFGGADSQQAPTPKTTARKSWAWPVKKRFGPAQFLDAAKSRVTYQSKLYPGAVLVFSLNGLWSGDDKRTRYRCDNCFSLNNKGKLRQKIAGVTVLEGEFVDHDPDLAGTAPHGHLCMKPDTVAELEAQLFGSSPFGKRTKGSSIGGVMQHFEYSESGQDDCDSHATPERHGPPMPTDVGAIIDNGHKSRFSTPPMQTAKQTGDNGSTGSYRRGKKLDEVRERFGLAQFADDKKRELFHKSRRYP
ncbi:hypothetical protein AAVH_38463, partial [Aphelenchoides avenae]